MKLNLGLFFSEEFDDSDGISVISDGEHIVSEMHKNHPNQSDNDEKEIIVKNENDYENIPNLLTPPITPHSNNDDDDDDNDTEEEQENENKIEKFDDKENNELEIHQELKSSSFNDRKQSHGALLLIVMSVIIALLYTNISSLKNELKTTSSMYEQRIANLEEQNLILKSQLNELIKSAKESQNLMSLNGKTKKSEKLLEEQFVEKQEPRLKV